jgi:metallo-beta-lactamase family protein
MLQFLGAAGTVTGSRFLVASGRSRVLIDCGLFQGLKELRLRNWDRFAIEPASIDAVLLSHAHLDHSGYLPALSRDGFDGRIVATEGTKSLCRIVLPDSGHLQEEEAAYANRKGYSKHSPARPLYTEDDALRALGRLEAAPFDTGFEAANGIRARFRPAGHILGSCSLLIEIDGARRRRILFSGDLGRPAHPLLRAPSPLPDTDVVVVESTYGDRTHDDAASLARFEETIGRTAARGGTIVIPSFAVDRTEVILFHIRRLTQAGRIPRLPVYVDSPMALASLAVYKAAIGAASPEVKGEIAGHPEVLDSGDLSEVKTVEDSIALNFMPGPMIIISASGMATGGRVLHHLAARLPDPRNSVILVGYQAEGTRGRSLLERAASVKMLGRYVSVRAEVVDVPAFSVHADQGEILRWLGTAPHPPEVVYLVHGEPAAAQALCEAIASQLRWNAVVPKYLEKVRLD